jgi:hypothetical protein
VVKNQILRIINRFNQQLRIITLPCRYGILIADAETKLN